MRFRRTATHPRGRRAATSRGARIAAALLCGAWTGVFVWAARAEDQTPPARPANMGALPDRPGAVKVTRGTAGPVEFALRKLRKIAPRVSQGRSFARDHQAMFALLSLGTLKVW